MEKRLFLAILLSMAVLLLWQVLFLPPIPADATDQQGRHARREIQLEKPEQETGLPVSESMPDAAEKSEPFQSAAYERVVVIESPLFRARLSSRGGGLQSLELKNYTYAPYDPRLVEMVPQPAAVHKYFEEEYTESDRQEILLHLKASLQELWLPYSLRLRGIPEGLGLGRTHFEMEAASDLIELQGDESTEIVFRLQTPSGLSIVKTLTFRADSYQTEIRVKLSNLGSRSLSILPELVVTEGYRRSGIPHSTRYDQSAVIYGEGGKRHAMSVPEKGQQMEQRSSKLEWVAIDDLYFFSAVMGTAGAHVAVVEQTPIGFSRILLQFDSAYLEPGETVNFNTTAYSGPKERDRLAQLGQGLDRIIDYGMFRVLAIPAIGIINFIQSIIGSYGVAIIILTILLKLVTYPLTTTQLRSMEKMKEIAPELEKLKAKHKEKDPQRFNQEMMNLYKREGVNPAGGCLPMFIQMPIFLALYSGLLYSIELRHSPFLYIPDLSNPDPYYISPLLMGAGMLLQQRMSPTPADSSQAMMTKILPIVFTGIFLFAPAGLVIYWLMNNVLSIGQQYLLRKRDKSN